MNYNSDFYNRLNKPSFQPPKEVFKPVWTTLYILMAAAFLIVVFKKYDYSKMPAITLFFIQLILNFIWPFLFFGLGKIKAALVVCILLTAAVFFTIAAFFKISVIAAVLLIPYFLWLIFASILNAAIVKLNPDK